MYNNTKLLHIGLGKCGSTFLQSEIFPIVAKEINTNYINLHNNKTDPKCCIFENYKKL